MKTYAYQAEFYRDLNGSKVRVVFENRRYFYEVVDGIPDRWVSDQPPGKDLTYIPSEAAH